jgi:DNA-binding NtrC family response regulator
MDRTRFLQVVKRAWEVRHLKQTIGLLDAGAARILGVYPAIERVRRLVDRMAASSAPVLVTGESGVGKEVVAEALHEQSRRRGELVRINCAALPASLIEAELFGAEEGSFTGQKGRREGLFAVADQGTIFLDEIGEMPIELQPKLLRALENHTFRPIGSSKERPLTARIVAATNVDLRAAAARGTFREDLFFRLAVLTIEVPPLRERTEDIALLANHFAKKYGASEGRAGIRLSDEALAGLVACRWPGNVRELANSVQRAVVLSSTRVVELEDLALSARDAPPEAAQDWAEYMDLPLTEAKAAVVNAFTRAYIEAKLAAHGGNVSRAAAVSGMQRPNFKREMRRLGVEAAPDDD